MLQPARTKYRKMMKGRMRGKAYRGSDLNQGEYGLQATECGWLTARQIEAARVAITRYVKRGGKLAVGFWPTHMRRVPVVWPPRPSVTETCRSMDPKSSRAVRSTASARTWARRRSSSKVATGLP